MTVGEGWSVDYRPSGVSENIRQADDVSASYDVATGTYTLKLPEWGPGGVTQIGVAQAHDHPQSQGQTFYSATLSGQGLSTEEKGLRVLQPGSGRGYKYVGFADWYTDAEASGSLHHATIGTLGVAIPTSAADLPRTGTATYSGDVFGTMAGQLSDTIGGKARFAFDFLQGTLTGELQLQLLCMWGCNYAPVTYPLTDTIFNSGSTQFASKLAGTGLLAGIFAGPGAPELLARFETPFFNPGSKESVTASGVILGKRD